MSVDLGTARAKVVLDTSQLAAGVASATGSFNQLEGSTRSLSSSLSAVSGSLAVIGGAVAVGVGAAVTSFGDFEQQINALGAVTGAAGDQLGQLSDLALQLGQDTSFGATEAAQALTELAKAGVPIEDILAGAGRAAVDLAQATGTDLATSANVLANTMNLFAETGLTAADAVDTLTAAANASTADLGDLAAGLRTLGPVVANLGGDLQDGAAAIAFFTNFGLKAADAGVSLARALDRAAAPTKEAAALMEQLGIAVFDAQGAFVGFPALFANLQRSLSGLSDEQRTLAINTIFGAEAQDVINIAVQEGADGYKQLRAAIEPAGQAAAASEARMKGLSGALEQMRGSTETAAIAFGAALAPAIEAAAGFVEQAANAFAALSPAVQQVAAFAVAGAGGFALLAAATAKTIAFAFDSVAAFARLAAVLRESAVAMAVFDAATGPIGVALLALAAGLAILVHRHQEAAQAAREHAAAIKELNAAVESFGKFVADLRLQGFEDAADAAEALKNQVGGAANALDEAAHKTRGATATAEDYADAARFGTINAADLEARSRALADALPQMQEALQHTGLDTTTLARDFGVLVDQLTRGDIGVDAFVRQLTDITTHLDRYKAQSKDAGKATGDLTDAQRAAAQATEDQVKAQEKFNQQVGETIAGAVRLAAGIEDVGASIDGVQAGFGRAGDSIETLVAKMDEAGAVDLSPMEREALTAERALQRLEAQGVALSDAIQNNQDDLSMWAGRISLVTDVLGGNTDQLDEWVTQLQDGTITQEQFNAAVADPSFVATFDKLDALYQSGAISQETYNEAKQAGIDILQRSAGGMQDENEELVGNLIALDAYIRKHDDADGAVKQLSEDQQGFLAAMESSAAQTALQTVNLLAYLAVLGLIPPEKVTEFIADSSAADPVLAALFRDLGLIPPKKTTEYTLTGDGTQQARDAKAAVEAIPPKVKIDLDFAATGDGTELLAGKGLAAFEKTIPVRTELAAPDTTAVDEAEVPPKTVETKLGAPDASAVAAYHPEAITIPTHLGAPLTDLVDNYAPPTVTIPTQLATPGFAEGTVVHGPDTIAIPTELGTPDATAVTDYDPPTVVIPTQLATPGFAEGTIVHGPDTVTIPTALGSPDDAAVADYAPPTVVVPTVLGTPGFAEGTTVQGPDELVIPTTLGTPDTAAIDDYAPPTLSIPVDADTTDFDAALDDATEAAQTFDDASYTTSIVADATEFDQNFDPAYDAAIDFANDSFETTIAADAADAIDAIGRVTNMASALGISTYTVTIAANIQPALDSLETLARNLPSSPAQEGPLAKEPNFDYVVDAFVASMEEIERWAERTAIDVGPTLRQSMATNEFATLARAGGGTLGAATGGGYVDARTFVALRSEEFARLLAGAEMGSGAHEWIRRREDAFAVVGA